MEGYDYVVIGAGRGVRMGFDEEGLPVGMQLTARHGEDGLLLAAARAWWEGTPQVQGRWPD